MISDPLSGWHKDGTLFTTKCAIFVCKKGERKRGIFADCYKRQGAGAERAEPNCPVVQSFDLKEKLLELGLVCG